MKAFKYIFGALSALSYICAFASAVDGAPLVISIGFVILGWINLEMARNA